MSELAFPLLALGLAIGVTYWFCIRPMRQGNSHCGPAAGSDDATRVQLQELRREVAELRAAQRPPSTVHIDAPKGIRQP